MTDHEDGDQFDADREDGKPRRIEIVLPRARSIVWLGIKIYLLVIVGSSLLLMTAVLLGAALIALVG